MHILLIHQSFVALNEPGGTRHYELARFLAENGHRVTVIASPVSYSLYKALHNDGNPSFRTVLSVAAALGYRFNVSAAPQRRPKSVDVAR